MSDMAKMTNEELCERLCELPECGDIGAEAARRLRGPDYRAEAMAARKLRDAMRAAEADPRYQAVWVCFANHGAKYEGPYWKEETFGYDEARTTNESKEAANG